MRSYMLPVVIALLSVSALAQVCTSEDSTVLTGAVAFGFWWDSLSAGLFACFALFFLAGIHRALRHIVATSAGVLLVGLSDLGNLFGQHFDAIYN